MYEAYWQLDHKPFEEDADPRAYYPTEAHQGALLKLRYAVENHRGGALLAGPSGVGKTLIIRLLEQQLAETYNPFLHLVFPRMAAAQLVGYLALELGVPSPVPNPPLDQSVQRLRQTLAANARQGRHAVLVVDEAHQLEIPQSLEVLRLLLNFQSTNRPDMTLILVGQTSLLPAIDRMPSLEERLGVKCLIRPLSLDETASYVQRRMAAAGNPRPVFEPAAIETLYELTQGNPRRINRLCDLALLIGFAEDRQRIGSAQIEAISQELVAVAPE